MTSARQRTPPVASLLPLLVALLATPAIAAGKPMKVYVLAGQSNMEGQAVVDLDGEDYNDGKGTLVALLADPAKAAGMAHLKAADGTWRVRDDVWMWYQPEAAPLQAGPLPVGYTVYGDQHHFGPELEFGHVVGELTGPWVDAPGGWAAVRAAQAAAAARPEFQGNVVFVPTRQFVRAAEDSPNPGHGHHEFGNAETCFLVGEALGRAMLSLTPDTAHT
jgi:hypothetical protein